MDGELKKPNGKRPQPSTNERIEMYDAFHKAAYAKTEAEFKEAEKYLTEKTGDITNFNAAIFQLLIA